MFGVIKMLTDIPYNRSHVYEYATKWAYERNPLFYNFSEIGGDCTNFVSQCVYAGCCTMNFDTVRGWYYISTDNRTPSWTGVEFFYDFIVNNTGIGPYAQEVSEGELDIGDVIQLGQNEGDFYHTLVVTGFAENTYLVSAHTYDSLNRRLDSYQYERSRFLHIEGVRVTAPDSSACFQGVVEGVRIFP